LKGVERLVDKDARPSIGFDLLNQCGRWRQIPQATTTREETMTHRIKKIRVVHLLLATCFALTAGAVSAQELAEHPPMKVGDFWVFQFHNLGDRKDPYEYSNTVTGLTEGSAWIYGESKEEGARNPKFVWRYDLKRALFAERFAHDPAAPNQAGKRAVSRLKNDDLIRWPLKVDDTFKAKTYASWGHTEWDVKVEAYEKVTVPAGTFDAFRMKRAGYWYNSQHGNSGRAEVLVWFSPEAKGVVKTVYQDWRTNGSLFNNEETVLVKWTPSTQ
jgi:hypothetical protein